MATYESLTPEQKAIATETQKQIRALHGQLARTLNQARSLQAAIDASGGLRDIVLSLDPTEVIPNTSGLAGSHDLSRGELSQLVGILDAFITTHDVDATRQLFAKAAGVNAGN